MASGNDVIYSLLDLAPIVQGGSATESFRNMLDLARHAERWGYHRFWLAEHHNIPGIASAATSVLIGHVAGGTERIRVGSGGIMLPNHAPLLIAEQFGTLESLYPGRIDLGIGRAPGGDHQTSWALRRHLSGGADTFPQDLEELRTYLSPVQSSQVVRAIPGQGTNVPIYLLGSSDFSARLAARLGLPFAFASHFAPDYLHPALALYRENFEPSESLAKPHVIVGANVFAADTDAQAARLFTTLQLQFLNLIRGTLSEIPAPVDSMAGRWNAAEEAHIQRMTRYSLVGSRSTVADQLRGLLEETQADEVIVTAQVFDHAARLRSIEITAEVFEEMKRVARDAAQ